MEFYNRENEVVQLQQLSEQAANGISSMTLLVGRRRIGKTALIRHCYDNDPNSIYLFTSRKSETLLCEEFIEIIANKINIPTWAKLDTFLHLLEFLLQQSVTTPLTLVIDEFQDLQYVDPAIFSGMQNLWDTYKGKSKIHLICCGSIYSIMCKLFENSKEPLFGRASTKIYLKALKPQYLRQILIDAHNYTPENLLAVYTIAGGVPRYLDLLHRDSAWEINKILDIMLSENSFFVNEGKDVLIEEFGKDYKTYFSILGLISLGKTARSEIESILQISVGGYLDNLEQEFSVLHKHKPIFAKDNSRTVKYLIRDNFLNFWFRYFYRNQTALEMGNFQYVKDRIQEDFTRYSGIYLEKMIRELLAASGKYNNIGSYWEKDNTNEIDVIACNEHDKKLLIADVKLQTKKLNVPLMEHKAEKLVQQYSGYDVHFVGYSLDNLDDLINSCSK